MNHRQTEAQSFEKIAGAMAVNIFVFFVFSAPLRLCGNHNRICP